MSVAASPVETAAHARLLVANVEKVIIGKAEVVTRAVAAMLAGGHILLEDIPGVGKTMLARALAKSVDGQFRRIQFTADLLPSDITGVNVYRQDTNQFVFREGPVFANVLLGDEINRATPRTQSSLLEAMEELQVTVDGVRHELPVPFFVVATQNPIELEGTYPLPFAQMDRFITRLRLGYLDAAGEQQMIEQRLRGAPIDDLGPVLDCAQLRVMQAAVRRLKLSANLVSYIVALIHATRACPQLEFGASPRAGIDLARYSQALAFLRQRDYVLPDDIKDAAPGVLAHRVIIRRGTRRSAPESEAMVSELLQTVPVPV